MNLPKADPHFTISPGSGGLPRLTMIAPDGGRAEYSVSGTATSAATVTLQGTKFLTLGGLGGNTPGSVAFTIAKLGAPSPNYSP